jgi:hypothetical protein
VRAARAYAVTRAVTLRRRPPPPPPPPSGFFSRAQFAVTSAAQLTGATVVSIDPRLPWDAVLAVLAAEAPRVLVLSPRGAGGDDRAAALPEVFAPELARFTAGASWGYEPLVSKRFRSLKYIVQTGFDDVPGVVQLADLASVGSGASQAARLRASGVASDKILNEDEAIEVP